MFRGLLVLGTAAALTACVTPAAPIKVAGGNQSEGTVVMSVDYNIMQNPQTNWQEGLQKASAQCMQWGYTGAIPSSKPSQTCSTKTQNGDCIGWTVSSTFQCTGGAQPQ